MGSMLLPLPFNGFFVVVFLLFLLLHLPILSEGHKVSGNCSSFHFCGNLNISYPFYNYNWRCSKALELLQCQNDATTLTDTMDDRYIGGNGYEVKSIDYSNKTALVHDRRFSHDFYSDNERCNFLFNNFSSMPPIFRYLSAEVISHNLTLRVCKPDNQVADNCTVEALPHASAPAPSPSATQSSFNVCKEVYLPSDLNISTSHGPVSPISKLFSELFSVGFRLRWKFPTVCDECAKNGTKCVSHRNKTISCSDPRWKDKGKMSQRKIIAIGVAGVVAGMLLTSLIFFIIYKYKTGHSLGRKCDFSLKTDNEKSSIRLGVPIFSYAELEEATDNFSSVNEVGDGGYGTVYRGKLQDGRDVAIKRLYHSNYKHVERFMNEIEILAHLRHQNLVTLYGCTSYRSRELLLVYEFIPNGTIADHLHGNRRNVGSLPWPVRMSIAMETASALSYLHASDVIHRDVKTSNILLDNHFHVKVADFGLSRLFPTDASHVSTAPQGTPGYVDPEYYRCYQLTDKSDVYSFGVVLIELISSKLPVDFTRHQDEIDLANMAINKIQNEALQDLVDPCLGFESDCSTRRIVTMVAELAFRCLQHDKELRPSMDEVLEILTAIAIDQECRLDNEEEIETVAPYDLGLLKNTPPPTASPDSGEIDKLVSQPTMPSSS